MASTISTSGSAHAPSAGNGTGPAAPWVYRPWLDLLVGCGAWSAPLLVFTNYVSPRSSTQWSFAVSLLAALFNYPHFMAPVYRASHTYGEFQRYRYFTVHVALLLAFAGLI